MANFIHGSASNRLKCRKFGLHQSKAVFKVLICRKNSSKQIFDQQHQKRRHLSLYDSLFYICDYLGVTPKEFFDTDTVNPTKANELLSIAKRLSNEQLDNLIAIAKGLVK